MKMRSLMIILCSILLSSCANRLILRDFIFEEQELPVNCRIVPIRSGEELPCGVKSNPLISTERQFLNCFSMMLVRDESLAAATHSALFSLYIEKGEVGIFGLEFDSDASASKAAELLLNENVDTQRFSVFQKGQIVIFLWRDDLTDTCFYGLKELIKARIR